MLADLQAVLTMPGPVHVDCTSARSLAGAPLQ